MGRFRREKHQGLGKVHILQIQETNRKIIDYLRERDSLDVNDSTRGIRSIHRTTKIDLKVLINRLNGLKLEGRVLEVKGSNKRRLFCLNNEKNKNKIRNLDAESLIIPRNLIKKNVIRLQIKNRFNELEKFCDEVFKDIKPDDVKHIVADLPPQLREYFTEDKIKIIIAMHYREKELRRMMMDDRQKLLPQMRPMLLALSSVATTRDIAKNYFRQIPRQFSISADKWNKFLYEVKTYSDFVEFAQPDPWNWGFFELECPTCKKFALQIHINLQGMWDLVCKNSAVHGKEEHFSHQLYLNWLEDLKTNRNGAAIKYLARHGIEIHGY